jgi:phosphatidate cytidylyltransferase
MLRTRVITAAVLLALLLPALFAPSPWPFALLTLVMIGAAGWEWGRLNAAGPAGSIAVGVLVALACVTAIVFGWADAAPALAWWLALLVWVLGGAIALRGGALGWPRLPASLRLALGIVALVIAWLALARSRDFGLNFLLSVFALVWVADIAAYFGGRRFGRRKLAPAISPGKSWEGVWSGMAAVALLAVVWCIADARLGVDEGSLYHRLNGLLGWGGLLLVVVFLVAMSVVGDLVESLVKRAAGMKDSSSLLPGHGGVLDRIDALLPVFPLALAFVSLPKS